MKSKSDASNCGKFDIAGCVFTSDVEGTKVKFRVGICDGKWIEQRGIGNGHLTLVILEITHMEIGSDITIIHR